MQRPPRGAALGAVRRRARRQRRHADQQAGNGGWHTVCELYGKVSSSKYANVTFKPGDRIQLRHVPAAAVTAIPRDATRAAIIEDVR